MNRFRMVKFRMWLIIAIISICIPVVKSSSQPLLEPIERNYEIAAFKRLTWSLDGQVITFENTVFDRKWVQVNLSTNQRTEFTIPPYLVNLDRIQPDVPETAPNQIQFAYASPNGRYIVYDAPLSAGTWRDGRPLIALTDLQTNETTVINLPLTVWIAKWSLSSNAFAIETIIRSGGTVVFYFSNFQQSVSQVNYIDLTDTVELNGFIYAADGLFSISTDGTKVLLRGYIRGSENAAVWEFSQSVSITSFAENVIRRAATFTPDDSGAYYLTKAGMFRYDFATQQTTPVALKAGTELLQNTVEGSISPDGKHVAIIVRDNVADDFALYVLEVAQGQ